MNLKSKIMKKIMFVLVMGVILLMTQSCATMIAGTTEKVNFKTNPSGAKIIVDGKDMGVTPSDVIVSKKAIMVQFQKDGYNMESFKFEYKTAGSYWLNVPLAVFFIAPALVGMLVDIGTGACNKHRYLNYEKTLTPIK